MIKITVDQARDLAVNALTSNGLCPTDANIIADHLIDAECLGRSTHGLLRIPQIIARIPKEQCQIKTITDAPAYALVDGNGNLGYLVVHHAMALAIEKAESAGVALVGVRNSSHSGMAGHFVRMALKRALIGMMICNTFPKVAVSGGTRPAFGTNPLAVAIPADPEDFVLDMSTASITIGDLYLAKQMGQKIPEGMVLNGNGAPTTDPDEALKDGILLPFGGHKGSGLGLMIQVLSAILTGHDLQQTGGVLLAAINPAIFSDPETFRRENGAYFQKVKAESPDTVLIPGERSAARKQQILATGIELTPELWEELNHLTR